MKNIGVFRLHQKLFRSLATNGTGDHFYIFLIESGKGTLKSPESEFSIAAHRLFFVYPHQQIQGSGVNQIKGFYVSFREDFVHQHSEHKDLLYRMPMLGYETKSAVFQLKAKDFEEIHTVFNGMSSEFERKKFGYEKIILSYVNVLLLKCLRFPGNSNKHLGTAHYTSLQIVHEFRQLIRQHAANHHSLSFYTKQLRQTTNYLNMVVKQVTGKTAGVLIHEQLIRESKRLLIHTKLSPKEIAFELGFRDHSYFTKFFKRHTGHKPLEWFNLHK